MGAIGKLRSLNFILKVVQHRQKFLSRELPSSDLLFLDQRLQLQGGGWTGGRETGGSGTSEKSTLITQAVLPKDG